MATIYVTGHRNPDTDSIASAIGYAELKGRLDPRNEYVPVRLGDLNAQTRWVLERSGAAEPEFLAHVLLRVRDVMQAGFPTASHRQPIREVGLGENEERILRGFGFLTAKPLLILLDLGEGQLGAEGDRLVALAKIDAPIVGQQQKPFRQVAVDFAGLIRLAGL